VDGAKVGELVGWWLWRGLDRGPYSPHDLLLQVLDELGSGVSGRPACLVLDLVVGSGGGLLALVAVVVLQVFMTIFI
jgi:hypothetical protein